MSDQPNDPFDDLIRRSLAREANRIDPADALPELQARVRDQRPSRRRPWVLTTGAAVLATAAAIGAFTVLGDDNRRAGDTDVAGPGDTASALPTTSAAPPTQSQRRTVSPRVSPEPTAATDRPSTVPRTSRPVKTRMVSKVPLYWVGDRKSAGAGPTMRLYRTYREVKGDPAFAAIEAISAARAEDSDYYSVWRGAVVSSVSRSNDAIKVDFKMLPAARVPAQSAEVAVQQLVYTVQGVYQDSTTPLVITEQGRPARLFGQIDTSKPIARAQQPKVQALVWITDPVEGGKADRPVKVSGIAAAFEGTVNWRVRNVKTRQALDGFTTAAAGQTYSPFTFALKLTPGEWQIEAFLLSAEDGSVTDIDTKTISVR